ncbi:MAG: hypothetical protein M3421_11095 [Bacteroidota bacterium]|nr:hypothetical protein [Bacteroidota bacterium]
MTLTHDPLEQENIAVNDEKTYKILLTGKASNKKIILKLYDAGFDVDFLPMELPVEEDFTNFSFKHLQPGIKFAQANGHTLIIGIDEETHKIAIAVKKQDSGVFQLLNVHQLSALLVFLWQKEFPDDNLTFVKSFHISEMIEIMAAKGGSAYKNVLVEPGLITSKVATLLEENREKHLLGLTENQEFFDNSVDFTSIIEKIISFEEKLNKDGENLFDQMLYLYKEFGFYKEKTFAVEFNGQSQRNHVKHVMDECKKNAASIQERLDITHVLDFKKGKVKNFQTNKENILNYPSVNMLQIKFSDGLSVCIVPQDQQVFYYFSMKGHISGKDMYQDINKEIDERIFKVLEILNKL